MKGVSRRGPAHCRAAKESLSSPSQKPPPSRGSTSLDQLREEYRRLYHSETPKLSRDLLVRAIGYRRQEIEHGGLGKATHRKLQTIAKTLQSTSRVGPTPSLSLKPGARLVREWHGRTHTVIVTDDGFEYAGASYSSLTKIAKKITGAHWSGPRFFGLLAVKNTRSDRERDDEHS
jgi:Protein of unknown function (DUF2924)